MGFGTSSKSYVALVQQPIHPNEQESSQPCSTLKKRFINNPLTYLTKSLKGKRTQLTLYHTYKVFY